MTQFVIDFAIIVTIFLAFVGLCSMIVVWFWVVRCLYRDYLKEYIKGQIEMTVESIKESAKKQN